MGVIKYIMWPYLQDTSYKMQPFDYTQHIPRQDASGAWSYKETDIGQLYWREVRRDNFRVGYKKVEGGEPEGKFDSSANYTMRSLFSTGQ
jgi:hypothetical protein